MRLIDADKLNADMYHEAFEKDSDMQKWDSGCWIRYKMFENVLKAQPTVQPDTTTNNSISAETGKNDGDGTSGDCISRAQAVDKFIDGLEEIFADLRERHVDDSVCGLCEYDGAYMGQSGDWCNECPGFDRDDCFKLSDKTRKKWTDKIIKALPSIQPEHKTGHWILDRSGAYCCDNCMEPCATYAMMKPRDKFCKMCGTRNEVTE